MSRHSLKWLVFDFQLKKEAYETCTAVCDDAIKTKHVTDQYIAAREALLDKILEEYG